MTQILTTLKNTYKQKGLLQTFNDSFRYLSICIKLYKNLPDIPRANDASGVDKILDLAFNKYKLAITPKQVPGEIKSLLNLIVKNPPKILVEIGTDKGGNLFLLSKVASHNARVFSLDLPKGEFGGGYPLWRKKIYSRFVTDKQSIELMRVDSHAHSSLNLLKNHLNNEPVDVLFIDGDHTYDGVKKDYEMYSPLVRENGIICFHDILENPNDRNIQVAKFWNEVKQQHNSDNVKEFIHDINQQQMGIGVIINQQS